MLGSVSHLLGLRLRGHSYPLATPGGRGDGPARARQRRGPLARGGGRGRVGPLLTAGEAFSSKLGGREREEVRAGRGGPSHSLGGVPRRMGSHSVGGSGTRLRGEPYLCLTVQIESPRRRCPRRVREQQEEMGLYERLLEEQAQVNPRRGVDAGLFPPLTLLPRNSFFGPPQGPARPAAALAGAILSEYLLGGKQGPKSLYALPNGHVSHLLLRSGSEPRLDYMHCAYTGKVHLGTTL
jgi:hypothetical protein